MWTLLLSSPAPLMSPLPSQDMQPLRLFSQPGHAARTSPVRHAKRGLGGADESRETSKSQEGGVGTPPPRAATAPVGRWGGSAGAQGGLLPQLEAWRPPPSRPR